MNCGFERELISSYADGALQREMWQRVEGHISGCKDCREELAVMRVLGEALHSLPRESAPHTLINRILAEAGDSMPLTAWNTLSLTMTEVWNAAKRGFRIEDEREEMLRRELPEWVTRWVLFI